VFTKQQRSPHHFPKKNSKTNLSIILNINEHQQAPTTRCAKKKKKKAGMNRKKRTLAGVARVRERSVTVYNDVQSLTMIPVSLLGPSLDAIDHV
jgi:hypothetical protein